VDARNQGETSRHLHGQEIRFAHLSAGLAAIRAGNNFPESSQGEEEVTMIRKRLYFVIAAAVLAGLGIGLVLLAPGTPRVQAQNFNSAINTFGRGLYLSAAGAVNTGSTSTALTIGTIADTGNTIFDASNLLLSITNPSGSGQAITGGNVQFTDTVGGLTSTITYTIPFASNLAAGANAVYTIPLNNGMLKTLTLNVTFAANPSASNLSATAVIRGAGSSTLTDQFTSGTLNSNAATVTLPVQGFAGAGGTISGSYSGSIDFFLSTDGGNTYQRTLALVTLNGSNSSRVQDSVGSNTACNFQIIDLGGASHVQLNFNGTYVSGSANVTLRTTSGACVTPDFMAADTVITTNGTGGPQSPRVTVQGAIRSTNPASGSPFVAVRTPDVFKTLANDTTSGNTAIWTPASGRKFRLMGYQVIVPGNAVYATTAGTLTVTFQDATTATPFTHVVQVPTTAVNGVLYNSGWISLGNGFVSSTANNALNVNLALGGTGALTAGATVNVCGVED
jgi:hypothetical protein